MARTLLVILLAHLLAMAGTPTATAQATSMPAGTLAADPPLVNFGIVQPHTLLEARFRLVNAGDQPVKVLQAVPSCQCTTIEIVGKQVPARGTLEVPVTMKVSSTGLKVANVKILAEGQPRPLTLELRAEVAYAVRVQVADASGALQPYIDAFDDASRLKGEALVSSVDGKPFTVRSVQGAPPDLVPGQGEAPRTSWKVRFDLPGAPCEQVPKYLLVETDRPEARLVDARVRHACTRISPGIDIAEFRSNAGVMAPGAGASFDIEVKQLGQNRIGSVTALDPRFKASLVGQKADGRSVLATVRIEPGPGVKGVFITPVRLVAVDPRGQPFQTQRPEQAEPGKPARMLTLPAQADLLVFGKVE